MVELSGEQDFILQNIKKGENVIVDAVAGSGKSTVVLSIASQIPNKKILQITYNSMLRKEVKEKVEKMGLMNMKVHTYHSLAVRHYLPNAHTDAGLRYILLNNIPPREEIAKYDIIVIDEAQDMSLLYFQIVNKFIRDMNTKIQILVLGDFMQGLYEFKGSDIRFLTLADKIWKSNPFLENKEFIKCNMKMSYRITDQMGSFINNVMLGENRLLTCREGMSVKYIRNSISNIERTVIYEITKLIENGVLPSEIFVLGASVKGINSHIRKIENVLVMQGIPCHVPMFEMEKTDEKVIGGKVVFSTFHCVKGRQRRYVFIVGFDNGYMDFFARNLPKDKCPNTLYVGTTRATHGLYLLESDNFSTDRPLEFLKMTHHEMMEEPYINFKGTPRTLFYKTPGQQAEKPKKYNKHFVTPSELIRFVGDDIMDLITPIIDRIFIKENIGIGEPEDIDVPNIIKTRSGFYEEVSDLTGIAIQSLYYDYINSQWQSDEDEEDEEPPNVLYELINNYIYDLKPNEHGYLQAIVDEIPDKMTCIGDYLYLANVLTALQEKLYFKLKQIDRSEYNWLTPKMVMKCKTRLENTIGKECTEKRPKIEKTILQNSDNDRHTNIDAFLSRELDTTEKYRFTARSDLITSDSLWEIKCTSSLTIDHKMQLVIYAWLWKMTRGIQNSKQFKLFNIKTGELYVINATMDDLNTIVLALLRNKFTKQVQKTDEEFIIDCIEKM